MLSHESLLIFGASARAAAFSALRAGLRPWCADLFADTDLRACCPSLALAPGSYPQGFVQASRQGPPGPWLYTGGLENRPDLVRRLARQRPLWGNDASVLRIVRSPRAVRELLRGPGLPCPPVRLRADKGPRHGRWLVKPYKGAGGTGIRFWVGADSLPRGRRVYFQQFIEGDACSALYVCDGYEAQLLGVAQQLIGLDCLHARPFAYCGSIGPIQVSAAVRMALERLGGVLVRGSGMRGLFGVDFILRDGVPWPVEVNPRYTASVEVLEHALGLPALELHRRQFESDGQRGALASWGSEHRGANAPRSPLAGKAILFARAPVVFPADGPWRDTLEQMPERLHEDRLWEVPAFADIPSAGQRIEAGRPVLTFFAVGGSPAGCRDNLLQMAADLDQWLWKS
jgi:predicted ATP-grasp superfamily ATP-dependent carboligase